jgi:RNA polymerase sigma factor (sigma-70 family)
MSDVSVSRPGWRAQAVPLRLRSDDRLARDAASGDTAAFAALYDRHHQPLYRYCRSIVANPDDAADALQSTMTRALASIAERNPAAPVRAWLFRIAHNESISLIRRRRTAEPLDAEMLVAPDLATDAEHRRRLADLVGDLQGLSERQRGALLMREVSGLGHAEIAAALGATEGAVKQSIYEARVALQDLAMGREMSCAAVQRELSDGDGRTARSRRLRGHLRSCDDCQGFRDALQARRSELALIAPVLPAAAAAAVLEAVIGAGAAGGGGLLAGLLGGGGAAKVVAVGAATVTAGAGAVTYTAVGPDEERRERAARTLKRDDAGTAAPRARKAPAVVEAVATETVATEAVATRDHRASTLTAQDREEGDSGGARGPGPEGHDRGESRGPGSQRRERKDGDGEDGSSGRSGGHDPSDDDEPDHDSSGPGSGEVELAEESSGSSGTGGGEPELDDDDEPEPVEEDHSGKG